MSKIIKGKNLGTGSPKGGPKPRLSPSLMSGLPKSPKTFMEFGSETDDSPKDPEGPNDRSMLPKKEVTLYPDPTKGVVFQELSEKYFIQHDKTGKTSYTEAEKFEIVNNFITHHMNRIFETNVENATKIKGSLKGSTRITPNELQKNIFYKNILKAIKYIGYTDGNFKNCDFLLCGETTNSISFNTYYYISIDNTEDKQVGRLFSALSRDIKTFGDSNKEIDTNLYKMMKRNKYTLKNENQKSLLFGKGHMADPINKTTIKRDLDKLFDFMKTSKTEANNGNVSPLVFDVESLRFFEFTKT